MLSNLIDRIKLPFRKDKELCLALYDIIGFYPHNITYYKLALMHKSIGHRSTIEDDKAEKKVIGKLRLKNKNGRKQDSRNGQLGKKISNERLEFLGDAILDAVVGDIVYRQYPGKPEGFLTNTRSKLVQRETLGKLAKEVGLTRLILSSGRNASHNSYMGGNAFEALVGAMYLDRGYDACMKFMAERILGRYINIDKVAYKEVNFKSKLLEWTQKNRIKMEYRLENQAVDDNGSPTFKYTVILEGVEGETGMGFSKKESQQHASEKTLKKLRSDKAFHDSVFAAKTDRTKMEEEPVQVVPDTEVKQDDFIVSSTAEANADTNNNNDKISALEASIDAEMTLSDVQATPTEPTREDIIAAAEAAAFEAEEKETLK